MIHPLACVEKGVSIGAGTRVWAYVHILCGAQIGKDCNICDQVFVEGRVVIGDRVTVKCGVHLWDGVVIEDDVFVGPAAVFGNDMFPRSKQYPEKYLTTLLKRGASIGANATIIPGVQIGEWAMIAAGAVVTRDVPAYALMRGSPARQGGWVCRCGKKILVNRDGAATCKCGKCFNLNEGRLVEWI